MKKFWKFLGITALAAALIPYRVKTDDVTGEKHFDALLWHVRTKHGGHKMDVSFGLKAPAEEPWVYFDEDEDFDGFVMMDDDEADELDELDELIDEVEFSDEDLADLKPDTPED